jgi:hypothetical protein
MMKVSGNEEAELSLTKDGQRVTRIQHNTPRVVLEAIQQRRVECLTCGWSDAGGHLLVLDRSPKDVRVQDSPRYGEFAFHLLCPNCKNVLVKFAVENDTHGHALTEAEKVVEQMRELLIPLEQKEDIPKPMNRAM